MLADEIAQYLAGAGLGLVVGATSANGIFAVPFPIQAGDAATCVIEYPGLKPVRAMGPNLQPPIFEAAKFQVLSRDTPDNAQTCRRLQQSIWAALCHLSTTLVGSTGGSTYYGYIDGIQSAPFFLKQDDSARVYYVCNYMAWKAPSP